MTPDIAPSTTKLALLDSFTSYLSDERHFSPYTARCYGADLRQYVDFLASHHSIVLDEGKEHGQLRVVNCELRIT